MTRAKVEAITHAVALLLVLGLGTALAAQPSWPVAIGLVALVALVLGLWALARREEDERIEQAVIEANAAGRTAALAREELAEVKKLAGRAFDASTQTRRAGPPGF